MIDMAEYSEDGRKAGHILAEETLKNLNSMVKSARELGLDDKYLAGLVIGFCEMTHANLEFNKKNKVVAVEDPF